MDIKIKWPDSEESEFSYHNTTLEEIVQFQAAMKTVCWLSKEHDVIIDCGVVTFVEKS
jgi:hypothetical protein